MFLNQWLKSAWFKSANPAYIVVIIEFHLLNSVNMFWTLSNSHVFLYCSSLDDVVAVEAEWSATGVVGGSADESVLSTVCERLWRWWRPPSMHIRQIHKFWASSFHSAVYSLLILESNTDWLATVSHSSMGQTPAQEAHWTWVVCLQLYHIYTCDKYLYFSVSLKSQQWIFISHSSAICSIYRGKFEFFNGNQIVFRVGLQVHFEYY